MSERWTASLRSTRSLNQPSPLTSACQVARRAPLGSPSEAGLSRSLVWRYREMYQPMPTEHSLVENRPSVGCRAQSLLSNGVAHRSPTTTGTSSSDVQRQSTARARTSRVHFSAGRVWALRRVAGRAGGPGSALGTVLVVPGFLSWWAVGGKFGVADCGDHPADSLIAPQRAEPLDASSTTAPTDPSGGPVSECSPRLREVERGVA